MPAVDLIVPGPLETLTGGYIYDRRIFAELQAAGWHTTVHAIDAGFPSPDAGALAAAGAILDDIPDGRVVVIDGLALTGLAPLLDAARRRLRLVALIHHPLALETGLDTGERERLRDGERAALAGTDPVIVTSAWTRSALADYGVAADRISVVEPGVDRPSPVTVDAPARASTDPLRLLTVGTVTPRKGHRVLVEALTAIRDRPWTLRCAGSLDRDPATVRALEAQIAAAGLQSRIGLLGELPPDRVADEYAAADLFVLASFLEGYGMVVAEAVAHGKPVVAAAAGAVADTLPDGAGLLVPPGDPAALARCLAGLCDDRGRLRTLSDGARAVANTIPDWAGSAARFAAALERAGA